MKLCFSLSVSVGIGPNACWGMNRTGHMTSRVASHRETILPAGGVDMDPFPRTQVTFLVRYESMESIPTLAGSWESTQTRSVGGRDRRWEERENETGGEDKDYDMRREVRRGDKKKGDENRTRGDDRKERRREGRGGRKSEKREERREGNKGREEVSGREKVRRKEKC